MQLWPQWIIQAFAFNTFRTANENFSIWARCRQRPQTRNSCSRPVLSFPRSVCGSNCPKLIIRGFPFKGYNSWTHLFCYNVFGARKLCRIDDLLPLKFRTQMVSPIQNILTKNLGTVCWVILTKTSKMMIVNLLKMVLIDLPIIKFTCQHHVSGYVRRVWHLGFFLLLIEIIFIAKLWIIVHFFVLKHEKQTLSYIHTKFEGDRNNGFLGFFPPIYFVEAPVFLP